MPTYKGNRGNLLQHWVLSELVACISRESRHSERLGFVDTHAMSPYAVREPGRAAADFDLVAARLPGAGSVYELAWNDLRRGRCEYPSSAALVRHLWRGPLHLLLCERDQATADEVDSWYGGVADAQLELHRDDWRTRFESVLPQGYSQYLVSCDPYMFIRQNPTDQANPGNMWPSDIVRLGAAVLSTRGPLVLQLSSYSAQGTSQDDAIRIIEPILVAAGLELSAVVRADGHMMSMVFSRGLPSLGEARLQERFEQWLANATSARATRATPRQDPEERAIETPQKWLYAASARYADVLTTYNLAYRHGILWRSYFANRQPPVPIPNVSHIRPGDTLYLGYREDGQIRMLARMKVSVAAHPLPTSRVFTSVPDELVSEFAAHGYGRDPILDEMVGISVTAVERATALWPSQGRNSITRLPYDPLEADSGEPPEAGTRDQAGSEGNVRDAETEVPVEDVDHQEPVGAKAEREETRQTEPEPQDERERRTGQKRASALEVFVGIDVGGSPIKGYDLCALGWRDGCPVEVRFSRLPHRVPLPSTGQMRPLVAQGALDELASLTFQSACDTAAALWQSISEAAGQDVAGVFIDSPSAFSRNLTGHGRFTEKRSLPGVSFQSTPSLCCGREHGGDWGWLVYGMVAFAACLHRGTVTLERWREALQDGLFEPIMQGDLVVRECFPTATISVLRARGRTEEVHNLVGRLDSHPLEQGVVAEYLRLGVDAVKVAKRPLFDRADALVAALSSLPFVDNAFGEYWLLPKTEVPGWRAGVANADKVEGAIAVPG